MLFLGASTELKFAVQDAVIVGLHGAYHDLVIILLGAATVCLCSILVSLMLACGEAGRVRNSGGNTRVSA